MNDDSLRKQSTDMKHILLAVLAPLFSIIALPGIALAESEHIVVEKAWARASIGVKRPGAAYMIIVNTGSEDATLTGLASPIAMKPEIHRTSTNAAGVSSMAPAGDIVIGPGEAVALEPGGLHAMLMRLQSPLIKGKTFPITLMFADGGEVTVDVPILSIGARGPGE